MKTASTLSPSPPLPRPSSSKNAARSTPAIIPLDYNYQTMSPSISSYSRQPYQQSQRSAGTADSTLNVALDVAESQYSSIFGDPVPPPPPVDFFGSQFPDAISFLRRPSMIQLSSEGEDEAFVIGRPNMRRLFSEVPYSSSISRQLTNANENYVTRLLPPDIQILPHSSGGSSSEPLDSPNYALLTPDDILRRPSIYNIAEPANTTELLETVTISDGNGQREFSEATRRVSDFSEDFKSNVGSLGSPPPDVPALPAVYTRQFSNESYSSSEWFRPASHGMVSNFPEFSKMPRLRPSSKNVMSIKRDEMPHSPVAAMINDSNGSSSGEERLMDTTVVLERATVALPDTQPPMRPPDPSATYRCEGDTGLLLTPQQFLQQRRKSTIDGLEPNFALPPIPQLLPPTPLQTESIDVLDTNAAPSLKREMSPAIIKDAVATGGDFRVDQARLHKKSSFTIISDKSATPQSSRAQSPAPQHHKSQISPFLGYGFKDPPTLATTTSSGLIKSSTSPKHQLRRKSFSSTQLKLPQLKQNLLTSDDSPRPSVQFNMSGRRSPSKMPQKGILQHRESVSSSQDQDPATLPTQQTLPPKHALPASALAYGPRMKSCETLPLITDPYRTAIPRLNRTSLDLRRESSAMPPGVLPRPLKPNPNPTRKQRGLLRVINSADSTSRIPRRSNWASMDDLSAEQDNRRPSLSPLNMKARRRSSSTSPERRSSTLTASDRRSSNLSTVTTSDFSFRRPSLTAPLKRRPSLTPQPQRRPSLLPEKQHRPSLTPQPQRRKSLLPGTSPFSMRRPSIATPTTDAKGDKRTPRSRIAKPSTLSPIIGTPNKDSSTPQSPMALASLALSETASETTSRRGSVSKIPVRNGGDSRSNSRMSSRVGSRSSSPAKDFTGMQLPLSDLASRAASSRSPSRATTRTDSLASTQGKAAASRSTSRASTKTLSRGPSRGSSRPNSRMEQARSVANSRSNSRLSQSSALRAVSVSPIAGKSSLSPLSRRKSISLSPQAKRRVSVKRRSSLSPEQSSKRGGRKSTEAERRNSRSRIPTRARSGTQPTATKSPTFKSMSKGLAVASGLRRTSPTQRSSVRHKEPPSAKKAPTSVRKPESSVKRTPSSVKKTPTDAKKKPSSLQKTPSRNDMKREAFNVQKKSSAAATTGDTSRSKITVAKTSATSGTTTSATTAAKTLKKEASALSLKKAAAVAELKRQPSALGAVASAAKVTAAKKATTTAAREADTPSKRITAGTPSAARKTRASPDSAETAGTGTDSGSAASTNSLKRQATKLRLMRAGSKMSLLSRKRSDSNLSRKFEADSASIAEETDFNAQAEQSQTMTAADDAASSILERSQKTLENVQKTVTEATDEIQKTITENLTDLKSYESDMLRTGGYESAASPTPSVATVVENKGASTGKGGASASRIGTAERVPTAKSTPAKGSAAKTGALKSPVSTGQPIEAAVSVVNGAAASSSSSHNGASNGASQAVGQHLSAGDADLAERVSERAISVLPEVESESANFQNYELGIADKTDVSHGGNDGIADASDGGGGSGDDFKTDAKRRSPDGQGGSTAGSGDKTGSQEYLEQKDSDDDDAKKRGCCSCCSRLCMPCRRSRCSRCCRRKKSLSTSTPSNNNNDESEQQPVLTPPSSAATTTNLDIVDEKKSSCWQKLNCCKRKKKAAAKTAEEIMPSVQQQMETIQEEAMPTPEVAPVKQSSQCGLCLSKFFCCRSVNKVKTTTSGASTAMHALAEPEVRKCCFCIPCRRKRPRGSAVGSLGSGAAAWQDPEHGITSTDASVLEGSLEAAEPKLGCCRRFWCCMCCRKKTAIAASANTESRRASMKAAAPAEQDTRSKLHVDLVEYNSKMKGAIPVLPLYLAWFCAICNTVFPGLGTLLSGIFCVCIGIPRFSHYDSAKARLGALIINTIVAFAQFFCVLFCFVGWGWSIWWGTIMLKCARKLSKIRKVERMEMEEERRQAEQAAAINATVATRAVLASEIEAAKQ